ncbi:MAG: DNA-protecting protein DprA [Lentisphaerae bacterium]|nr:DNA-protecting protein DprA [Lentisphaerota bacterium]
MNQRDGCIALNMIPGIGYVRFSALVEFFGNAGLAAGKSASQYRQVPGINAVTAEKLASADWQELCENEKALADRSGVRIYTLYDEGYPPVLRELHDPPLCLYVRGRLPEFPGKTLGVVGSRKMSRYGENMTRSITTDAVGCGFVIISGLAYGVDTIAHRTTVECGGTTVAVLGGGLLNVQPQENIPLAQDIVARGGAIITEFAMNCPVSRTTFPRRNRIIAALSQGVLVVEAGTRSGALITAKAAVDIGRDVFAVPGQATNELAKGCHQLIREGAVLTEGLEDILAVLDAENQPDLFSVFADSADSGTVPYNKESVSDLAPELAAVLNNISSSGTSIEELCEATGMDTAALIAAITQLEFKFLIKRGADMLYYPER